MNTFKSSLAVLLAFVASAGLVVETRADTLTVTRTGSGAGTVTSDFGAIDCGATCADDYPTGTLLILTAAPGVGSQFTGWLGPCTGTGACQFTIAGSTAVSATFAPTALGAPALDIDGTTSVSPLTDGLLVLRFLFGASGEALIDGAVGAGASRNTAALIGDYLTDIKPALDVDGNGQVDALTDGLLIFRYLSGIRGDSLIAGVVGEGALHTTAAAIEGALAPIAPGAGQPPDPATVAPPTDPTVVTGIFAATVFLHTGPNPIQTGVVPGTIQPYRMAVIRGKVRDRNGAALSGAQVSILQHPEFGQTFSRADGMYDLVINGGGKLIVRVQKTGYFEAQARFPRQIEPGPFFPLFSSLAPFFPSSFFLQQPRPGDRVNPAGSAVDVATIPDSHHQDGQHVLDTCDDPVIANTVLPEFAEARPFERTTDRARVVELRDPIVEELQYSSRFLRIESIERLLGLRGKLNLPHDAAS